jgi:hypothetical protein
MISKFLRNRFGRSDQRDIGRGLGQGRGRGRGGGTSASSGPGGNCLCPSCGHKLPHVAGERCLDRLCPKCGTKMTRE